MKLLHSRSICQHGTCCCHRRKPSYRDQVIRHRFISYVAAQRVGLYLYWQGLDRRLTGLGAKTILPEWYMDNTGDLHHHRSILFALGFLPFRVDIGQISLTVAVTHTDFLVLTSARFDAGVSIFFFHPETTADVSRRQALWNEITGLSIISMIALERGSGSEKLPASLFPRERIKYFFMLKYRLRRFLHFIFLSITNTKQLWGFGRIYQNSPCEQTTEKGTVTRKGR